MGRMNKQVSFEWDNEQQDFTGRLEEEDLISDREWLEQEDRN